MDFERGVEFGSKEALIHKESGYSEEELAKAVEGSQQDVKNPPAGGGNKRKPLPTTKSRKDKIIATYRENLEKIFRNIEAIADLNGKNFRQEEQLIEEIRLLRHLQEELLNALLLEQKGLLKEESISKEAWNLIK